MEFIMDIIRAIGAFFDVLFAIPILGILVLASTLGPMIVSAIRRK